MLKTPWRQYRLMIAILAVTAYIPTLETGFMWDDHVMIENNTYLENWSLKNLKHDFTTDVFDGHGDLYYRPFQTLMHRVEYSLWGARPLGYHLVNLAIQLANAILLAELLLALGFIPLTAFVAGSLFAVHPIVVEQLMIVAGLAELSSLFFCLITLLAFLKKGRTTRIIGWAAYGLALFTKESGVIIPLLLALVYFFRKEPRERYRPLLGMLLLIFPYLALRHYAVGPTIPHFDGSLTWRFFILEFPCVIVRYLEIILIPWNLHSHRVLPRLMPWMWSLYLTGIILAAGFAVKRYGRLAIFCIGWFLLVLLPKTPAMIYGNFMLDHWAYPALPAVLLPLALGVTRGWQSQKKNIRLWIGTLYFILLIAWALLVHLNVALRGTDERMYRWSLRFSNSNPVKYNLAVLLLQTHRPVEAAEYLEDVKVYYPDDPRTIRMLAIAYFESGHHWLGIRQLENYLKHYPPNSEIINTLKKMKSRR